MTESQKSEIVIRDGRLYHLGLAEGEVAPHIFLVGDPARAYRVAERFGVIQKEIKEREFITITGVCRGLPMTVIATGIGTDNVEIALIEALAAATCDLATTRRKPGAPTPRVIRIGTSGGIQANINPGTIAISEYALGLDSTGLYYQSDSIDACVAEIESRAESMLQKAAQGRFKKRLACYASKASSSVYRALCQQAQLAGVDFCSGITASTSGFYGPSGRFLAGVVNTVPNLKAVLEQLKVQDRQVVNVEMESSLLFYLARLLGCEAGTICPVISNPYSHHALADYRSYIEQSIDIAIAAMEQLASNGQTGVPVQRTGGAGEPPGL